MLIDCHVHLLPPRRLAGLMRWMHDYYPQHPIPPTVTLEECIAHYDTIDVDYIFNLVYPIRVRETEEVSRFNHELHRAHPWILPFGSLHVEDPDKGAVIDRAYREYDFVGFKFHPFIQAFDPLDPRMLEAYERLQAWGRPVIFHTGYEEFYGKTLPPATMEEIVRAFPRLPVVFAHSLFPAFADAWRLLERHDNVWLEMTNVFGTFWEPRYVVKEYATEKALLLQGIGPRSERIMFGTDHPAGMGTLVDIYRTLEGAGLGEGVRERLVGGTAERFLRRFRPDFAAVPPKKRVVPTT